MELVSRHYKMNKEQVFPFDWIFLKPLINELNQLKEEYYICHSHYFKNPTTPNEPYHITMRILASKNIIDKLFKFEKNNMERLNYRLFDKDNEQKNGPITIKKLENIYNISEDEMLEIFKIWNQVSQLKVKLIELWQNGKGSSWNDGVHYALNSFGLDYNEEYRYRNRNLPPKKKS